MLSPQPPPKIDAIELPALPKAVRCRCGECGYPVPDESVTCSECACERVVWELSGRVTRSPVPLPRMDVGPALRIAGVLYLAVTFGAMGVWTWSGGTRLGTVVGAVLFLSSLATAYLGVMLIRARLDRRLGTLRWELSGHTLRVVSPHPHWVHRSLHDVRYLDVTPGPGGGSLVVALGWAPNLRLDTAIELSIGNEVDAASAKRSVEALLHRLVARAQSAQ
jgi:hypothetical protein